MARELAGRPFLASCLAALLLTIGADVDADDAGDELLPLLQAGGYNIFWRHAHAGAGMDIIRYTTDETELRDCARQRDLDGRGQGDARAVGAGFREAAIPVGEVLASPYCRTMKSAHIAFPEDRVRREDGIATVCQAPAGVMETNTVRLRELLATPPPAGTNRVLVSHNCNIRALARDLTERCAREPEQGDAVVFGPVAAAPGFEFVACLPLARMRGWARGG